MRARKRPAGLMSRPRKDRMPCPRCGEPGEDTCYRPRYNEDGTPIGEVGG